MKRKFVVGLVLASTIISSSGVKADIVSDSRLDNSNKSIYVGNRYNTSGKGLQNTSFGQESLSAANNSSHNNTALGFGVMTSTTSGSLNTGLGSVALALLTTGRENTAVGQGAMLSTKTGSSNVALGMSALYSDTTGSENTIVGYRAGDYITSGSNNILLGSRAGRNGTTTRSLQTGSNNILIGNSVLTTSPSTSNELNIGDLIRGVLTGTKSVTVAGAFTADSINTAGNIAVTGTGTITSPTITTTGLANLKTLKILTTTDSQGQITTKGLISSAGATITEGNLFVSKGFGDFFGGVTTKAGIQADKALFLKQRLINDTVPTVPSGYAGLSIDSAGKLIFNSTATQTGPVLVSEVAGLNDLKDLKIVEGATVAEDGSKFTSIYIGKGSGGASPDPVNEFNVAIGDFTLAEDHGVSNIAIGAEALASLSRTTDGSTQNESADSNTAIGDAALVGLANGSRNIALGSSAGLSLDKGSRNILIGNYAGAIDSSEYSPIELTTGSDNILIGNEVLASGGSANNELNIGNLITGNMGTNKSATIKGNLNVDERIVTKSLTVSGGSPAPGMVLTAVDTVGNVAWKLPPSSTTTTTTNLNSPTTTKTTSNSGSSTTTSNPNIEYTTVAINLDANNAGEVEAAGLWSQSPIASIAIYETFSTPMKTPKIKIWLDGELNNPQDHLAGVYIFQITTANNNRYASDKIVDLIICGRRPYTLNGADGDGCKHVNAKVGSAFQLLSVNGGWSTLGF